jgi:hypothetical protein
MNITPITDVCFDDKATLAMGAAFDQACSSLGYLACDVVVRELLAKRIIGAARNGQLDPIRLRSQALIGLMPVASVGRPAPRSACAKIAPTA